MADKSKKVKNEARSSQAPPLQSASDLEAPFQYSEETATDGRVILISDLSSYSGISVNEKVLAVIAKHEIVMIDRSWCLFSLDAQDFLLQLGLTVFSLEVDKHPQGSEILKFVTTQYHHKTYAI